ncbi:flagellar export chaperone FliS [Paraclostridium sordellii]|uniref:Flagellar secretion chaperone FliS n=2 Tax=Paraclostridium sordellii TaxID=1505 RepID=A0A9P1P7T2_PARSO|nr:flagellar export chaperone FliS [Paeniclostridium sordellii]MDU7966377.1 flagellar export chaperone FliS [Paeniclostridium sordellii]CEK32916.1 flagellar protein FliS1,Flagellar protein fliS,flagellar protein FliS,flagellar protein FliS,Flagellar protein FliS [[Clostridium] sordellii] [Paeniclostridium sordellii]CEN25796.1 flagellar protein FliS1 [[Clostridium] sordellii] [Paeniclostridium sordellii]CEN31575.1 flagellar protein FliS1 [[Clostridium] sordellii] [Paeniclostridium sordellii]CEN
MYTANPYNAYKQNSVNTASKEKLLIMLVDGAVKYTKIARMAILEKNIEKAHKELTRVQDIFLELMITMDKDSNKFMQDLYNVYDFIKSQLAMANIKKDVKIIDNVLPLIEEIRDMWHEVDKKIKSGK